MAEDDTDYLQRRAEEELEMAQRAGSPEATATHYKLANAYLERIEAVGRSADDGRIDWARQPGQTRWRLRPNAGAARPIGASHDLSPAL